jgi:GAF domain-containing protein
MTKVPVKTYLFSTSLNKLPGIACGEAYLVDSSADLNRFGALKSAVMRNLAPALICAEVARIFDVRETEVALLQVKRSFLEFVFPLELKAGGSIPLSSSAVAAKTATEKKAEVFNSFTTVRHASIFEVVKLGSTQADLSDQVIQKLMSAPVLAANKAVGVIQVSRKGRNPAVAGPDFTPADQRTLELAAEVIAPFFASIPSNYT